MEDNAEEESECIVYHMLVQRTDEEEGGIFADQKTRIERAGINPSVSPVY